jgi:hypothetical protein
VIGALSSAQENTMRYQLCTYVFLAAALYAADAEAKPRRVVVLEFDGPRRLADSGRAAVMGVLGDRYNIVATRTWDAARARAAGRGPQQWRQASRQARVDAVIEGWVQKEGRHHVLTVAVREAATGRELDTLSVRIKDDGMTPEASDRFGVQLEDLLSWIDGDLNADPEPLLPDVRTLRPMLGARDPDRDRRRIGDDGGDDDRDDDGDRRDEDRSDGDRSDSRGRRHARRDRHRDDHVDRDDRGDRDSGGDREDRDRDDGDRDERTARDRDARDRDRDRDDKLSRRVAALDDDTNDLVSLFGPESKEAAIVSEGKTTHTPKPTPRFVIAAGPYVSARGMTFDHDPEAKGSPPEYPGQTLKGFSASAAVYPMPRDKVDGKLSGIGFSLSLSHSVMSTFSAMDDTGYGDYTLNHVAWDTGVHYRWPVEFVALDIDASFGNFSHRIVDLPESIQIPDTSYSYLAAGGRVDLRVTEGTTVGFGAHYMYLLGAGDISDQDWYGAGTAWGAVLDGNFVIPLSGDLFVEGGIEYRRVKVDFEGSGMLTQTWGVWDVVDSSISGSANLGVTF